MNPIIAGLAIDAEKRVLGSMLIDPETVGPLLHMLSGNDFTEGRHRAVFQAIRKLQGQGRPADALTVNEALGGNYRDILADILDNTPTAANAEEYAAVCRRCARRIRLAELGEKLAEVPELEEAEKLVDQIDAVRCEKPSVRIVGLRQCYEEFLDRHAEGKQPAYLTWGIPALDERIYIEAGDLVVLGGYPSAGKTALALQMAYHIAGERRVGYFYLENNDRKLFDRLVSARSLVPFGKIKRYDLGEDDFAAIAAVQDRLVAPELEFVDASGMTVQDVRSVALSRRYGVAVVDYLQKLQGPRGQKSASDFERVSAVSSALQNMGRQTGIVVLALSQLSRPEKRGGKAPAPGMHSFRQSGQIEQDADVALLLYKDDDGDPKSSRTLKIGKNKEGVASIAMRMYFDGDTQTFRRISERPEPRERQKPRQVSFWDGWQEIPDDGDDPFGEEAQHEGGR